MFFKYSLQENEPFMSVSFVKRGNANGLKDIALQPLYVGPRLVSKEKYLDIQKLLKYVPPIHHKFYKESVLAEKSNSSRHIHEDELLDESDFEGEQ